MTLRIAYILSLTLFASAAQGSIAIIVHNKSELQSLSIHEIQRIYLGKMRHLQSGDPIEPVINDSDSAKDEFLQTIVAKSWKQFQSYWHVMVFTGKGQPPKELQNDQEVKKWVSENLNGIGYIQSESVDKSIRSIFEIGSTTKVKE